MLHHRHLVSVEMLAQDLERGVRQQDTANVIDAVMALLERLGPDQSQRDNDNYRKFAKIISAASQVAGSGTLTGMAIQSLLLSSLMGESVFRNHVNRMRREEEFRAQAQHQMFSTV